MPDRIRFFLNRLGERLWVKPLAMCFLSVAGAFLAKGADQQSLGDKLPTVTLDSVETLLVTMSASMLVIATFSVGAMVSAYSSASNMATPRAFTLVVADDASQTAMSTFIGAFIFSIVALVALKNAYYGEGGRFVLFLLTLLVFAIVIGVFVRWTDRIARLGQVSSTVEKLESAAAESLQQRRLAPTLCACPAEPDSPQGEALHGTSIGYVQQVDIEALQACAERGNLRIRVAALPGTFTGPGRPLAYFVPHSAPVSEDNRQAIEQAFLIGNERVYDDDPRFGLIVLAEVASRALSPGVNDPGTAIDIIGRLVRLFALWLKPLEQDEARPCKYERVEVPEIALVDMFDDAFTPIARDGSGTIEVVVRILKALHSLTVIGDEQTRDLAKQHARLALARAELALSVDEDRKVARAAARFAMS